MEVVLVEDDSEYEKEVDLRRAATGLNTVPESLRRTFVYVNDGRSVIE